MKPQQVGIKAIEVHFPKSYILQDDLEEYDIRILGEEKRQQIKGKYTKGLGQTSMAFCSDHEDVVSIALNAVTSLFEKYNLSPSDFGRVEIGTESSVDRSKSIKSFLMQLFENNHSVLGVDNTNACYGGTAALLNSIAWVESSQWDQRLALVVCTDIAVYEEMSPRPTGGCGAVAIVIGPNAPIVFESEAHYFLHSYDFYKPNFASPIPIVDGPLSLTQYYECLENCFLQLRKSQNTSIDSYDYICYHTPFINHIKKCTGRLLYIQDKADDDPDIIQSRSNSKLVSEWSAKAKDIFETKVRPSCTLSEFCGNGYTSSLYLALASLIDSTPLQGKRILCFSYGSGAASSIYSLKVVGETDQMQKALQIKSRLDSRIKRTVEEYLNSCLKAKQLYSTPSFQLSDSLDLLWNNSYYLDYKDDQWRRFYKKK